VHRSNSGEGTIIVWLYKQLKSSGYNHVVWIVDNPIPWLINTN